MELDRDDMADESDRASVLEQMEIEISLRAAQRAARRQQEPDNNGVFPILDCVECGEAIGEGRIKVAIKNTLCIYCATLAELR